MVQQILLRSTTTATFLVDFDAAMTDVLTTRSLLLIAET